MVKGARTIVEEVGEEEGSVLFTASEPIEDTVVVTVGTTGTVDVSPVVDIFYFSKRMDAMYFVQTKIIPKAINYSYYLSSMKILCLVVSVH